MFILSHVVVWQDVAAVLLALTINHPFLAIWGASNASLVYMLWDRY